MVVDVKDVGTFMAEMRVSVENVRHLKFTRLQTEPSDNTYFLVLGSGDLEDKDQQNAASEIRLTTNDESTEMDLKHSPEHPNDQQSRNLCPITPYLENAG